MAVVSSSPINQVEKFGRPTWKKVVEAVQDRVGGNNPALAENIAGKHPAPGKHTINLVRTMKKMYSVSYL